MMGTFEDTILPTNISQESLPDKFCDFFVSETEQIRSSLDPDRPIPTDNVEFSWTFFAEFQLVTDDSVTAVLKEVPKKSCYLDPIPVPILCDSLEEITPIVDDKIIVYKYLSSGVVPRCFKHALVKPLPKKANLDPNCLKKLPSCFQSAIFVTGAGVHCVKTVFAALGVSQPSGALPVSVPKMP